MVYKRRLYPILEKELLTRETIVITGMRRVGKTTALEHLFQQTDSGNKAVFDLENPLHRKVFEAEDYDAVRMRLGDFGLTDKSKAYIFIDEVQNLPEISRVVKYLYDHYDMKFVLTGSSSFYLRNLFPESMAGRKLIFELFPLGFGEFLEFKGIAHIEKPTYAQKAGQKSRTLYQRLIAHYDEYMQYGGFPAVVLEKDPVRKQVLLNEVFTSYFEKDAKNLADFRDMNRLRDLILLLAVRAGSKIEVARLAGDLGLSRATIYSYLTFLEQTYFISLLSKYSGSAARKAAGSKKLFFCDCGILNVLGRVSSGQIFEQSVFQNLRLSHSLDYYYDKQQHEIDFILDGEIAAEVKMSASTRDINSLKRRSRKLGLSESYLISHAYCQHPDCLMPVDL